MFDVVRKANTIPVIILCREDKVHEEHSEKDNERVSPASQRINLVQRAPQQQTQFFDTILIVGFWLMTMYSNSISEDVSPMEYGSP